MKATVERISECFELGEGPHWDEKKQYLYFVDIFGKSIHRYVPATKQHTKAILDKFVSFIIPIQGQENQFLISLGRDIVAVKWDGVSSSVSEIKKIAEVDTEDNVLENRLNDGKADPTGRLWTGTMGPEPVVGQVKPNSGHFYSLSGVGKVKKHVSDVHISNGLAWSADQKKFYYIDSGKRSVDQFDYDAKSETISNRQTLFSLEKNNIEGFPDGQTIDEEGNLWVAIFNGHKVIKIATHTPDTLLDVVEIPAAQITSVVFGGKNLDELYVTSARMAIDGKVLSKPENGAVYRVTGLGIKGLPSVEIKL